MSTRQPRKLIILLVLMSLLVLAVSGCADTADTSTDPQPVVRIATIQGPTGIGMVQLMEQNDKGTTQNTYEFVVEPSAQNIAGLVISGDVDMACVPTNLAATLYNRMEGQVRLIAINTLGVLYILENGTAIDSMEDLRGKTLHVSGQGAVPEYAIAYLLEAYGLSDEVDIEYYTDHDELGALMAAGQVELGMLPEPKVTATLAQNDQLRIALDMTEVWEQAAEMTGSPDSALAMGGVVVRTDFLEANPEAVGQFLDEYRDSIDFVNANVDVASQLVEKFGIMPSAAVAARAIPNCNIVYMDGTDMETAIRPFYDVLFDSNPQSVGGVIPGDDFYHIG